MAEPKKTEIQTRAFIAAGWMCPECFGCRIEIQRERASDHVSGFLCIECGCQFGSRK